jgi:hypothetical protein
MKHLFIILLATFSLQTLIAQEFDIREFKAEPSDLAARRNQMLTVNGEPCALIKVTTNIKGMQFESNVGIVEVVHQNDGYWVYVAPRERRVKLMADGFISLDVVMPEPAKSLTVYHLIVAPKGLYHTSDLVRLTFRMNQSNVYIRSGDGAPVLSVGNNAVFNVPKGKQTYRFMKNGFEEVELNVDIEEEEVVDVNLVPGETDTKFNLSGWVIITSEPSGAEVFLNEQRVGVTPYQGRNIAGQYNLRLRYQLHHDHVEQFELEEGATVTLPTVNLKPRFGYWQITSSPSNAEVLLDGKLVGTTPLARGQISSGSHKLTVRKSLYYDHTENFNINDGDDKRFDITLKEAFGSLEITSDPIGATVYIDGREVGTTPYKNPQQPSGRYNLRLAKDLYSEVRDQITVSDGKKTEKFLALSKNYGTLKVTAQGSEIFLDGRKMGSNSYSANLNPGQYTLRATKDKHEDAEKDVFIALGQTESVTLTPRARMGAVSIVSNPFDARGAQIFINGISQNKTTPAVIPLLIGTYNVKLAKPNYLESTQEVVISEGKEHELVFNMKTYKGSLQEKATKYKRAKALYGTATLAAAGTGTYFLLTANKLHEDYKTATTNATEIYDKMERYDLYAYISYGVAVPLGVFTVIKHIQQRRTERKVLIAILPINDGLVFGMSYRF